MDNASDKSNSVSISKAELQLLDALIALEQERRGGAVDRVVVFDPPESLGIWVKVGKWAWKNRKKLVAVTTALTDLVGMDAKSRALFESQMSESAADITDAKDTTLDELLEAREVIARAAKTPPESEQ